jgi:hypothetical protein
VRVSLARYAFKYINKSNRKKECGSSSRLFSRAFPPARLNQTPTSKKRKQKKKKRLEIFSPRGTPPIGEFLRGVEPFRQATSQPRKFFENLLYQKKSSLAKGQNAAEKKRFAISRLSKSGGHEVTFKTKFGIKKKHNNARGKNTHNTHTARG